MALAEIFLSEIVSHVLEKTTKAELDSLSKVTNSSYLVKAREDCLHKKEFFNYWKTCHLYKKHITDHEIVRNGSAELTLPKCLLRLPLLQFKPSFIGSSNYIDGISNKDLTHPVMIGIDNYGRYYLTIKYQCDQMEWGFDGDIYTVDRDKTNCLTIFQRLTGGDGWCKAGCDCHNSGAPFLHGSPTLLSEQDKQLLVQNIFKMMVGDDIIYMDYDNKDSCTPKIKKTLNGKLAF